MALGRTLELNSDNFPKLQQGSPSHALTCAVVGMDDPGTAKDMVYGLSGEAFGCRILEALLEVCASSVYRSVWSGLDGRLKDYAMDDVANYALQAVMCHCRDSTTASSILFLQASECGGPSFMDGSFSLSAHA